jgi:hypothetical protein
VIILSLNKQFYPCSCSNLILKIFLSLFPQDPLRSAIKKKCKSICFVLQLDAVFLTEIIIF